MWAIELTEENCVYKCPQLFSYINPSGKLSIHIFWKLGVSGKRAILMTLKNEYTFY